MSDLKKIKGVMEKGREGEGEESNFVIILIKFSIGIGKWIS